MPSSPAFDVQVAGYAVEYSNLTYVLVAGGVHSVSRVKSMSIVVNFIKHFTVKSLKHINCYFLQVGLIKTHHMLELFNDFINGVF